MSKTILVMAGGTGGHIYPALTVADALHAKGHQIHWLGAETGMERELVANRYPISYLSVTGLRRKGLTRRLLAPWMLCRSLWQALGVIRRQAPDLVIGMGGFVSGPGGIAAKILGVPLIIHEQNAAAGLTNRLLSRVANRVLSGFPGAFASSVPEQFTGNPVRQEIVAVSKSDPNAETDHRTRVLIMGGSQGARCINQAVTEWACSDSRADRYDIWHQTGARDFDWVQARYRSKCPDAKITPYIDQVASAYAWADLVICRSGALTVSEIATVGIASILIPYAHSVDNHQLKNAQHLSELGGTVILTEAQLAQLPDTIEQVSKNTAILLSYAGAAKSFVQCDALARIISICEGLL